MKSNNTKYNYLLNLTLKHINNKDNSTSKKLDSFSKEFLLKINNNYANINNSNLNTSQSENKKKSNFKFNPINTNQKESNCSSKYSSSSNLFDKITKVYNETMLSPAPTTPTSNAHKQTQLSDFFLNAQALKTKHIPRSSSTINSSKSNVTTISNHNFNNSRNHLSSSNNHNSLVKTKMKSLHYKLTNNTSMSPCVSYSYKHQENKLGRNNNKQNNKDKSGKLSTKNSEKITNSFRNTLSITKPNNLENSINNLNNSIYFRNNLNNFGVDLGKFLNRNLSSDKYDNHLRNNNDAKNNVSINNKSHLLSRFSVKKLCDNNFRNDSANSKSTNVINDYYYSKKKEKSNLINIKPEKPDKNKYKHLSTFFSKNNDANWYQHSFNKKTNVHIGSTNNKVMRNNSCGNFTYINDNSNNEKFISQMKLYCI